jgi:hypothetical protein
MSRARRDSWRTASDSPSARGVDGAGGPLLHLLFAKLNSSRCSDKGQKGGAGDLHSDLMVYMTSQENTDKDSAAGSARRVTGRNDLASVL